MSQEFSTPEHAAQDLVHRLDAREDESKNHSLCFGPSGNGYFTHYWSAEQIGTHDWVGLYRDVKAGDGDYIGGSNWRWASKGEEPRPGINPGATKLRRLKPAPEAYLRSPVVRDGKLCLAVWYVW